VPDAEKRLFDDLNWAGLEWDEGENEFIMRSNMPGHSQSRQVPTKKGHMGLTDK
jgi:glutamyl/glutaminyl-tRNA synthetase